jgi:hypothetical protein
MGRFYVIGIALLLVLFGIGGLLYYQLGLREYLAVRAYLQRQGSEARALYAGRAQDNVYGGILAGIAPNRLWLWGEGGLTTYPLVYGESSYTYFSMCHEENRAKIAQGESALSIRRLTTVAEQSGWGAQAGDYVRVELAGEVVREAHGFDWWVFAQLPTKELCRE